MAPEVIRSWTGGGHDRLHPNAPDPLNGLGPRASMTDKSLQLSYRAIEQRLERFKREPPGVLFVKRTELHDVVIEKVGSQLRFIYKDPTSDEIMSRIDVEDPLNLLALYTQAMCLTLAWVPEPRAVYVLGFGGGRLPLVLHHFFPAATIECTDIESCSVEIAERFFAVALDSRLHVAIQDGREYLEDRQSRSGFDIIFVDAFRSTGYGPYHLATREFYDLCKTALMPGGIVAVNLLTGDQLHHDKVLTFQDSFKQTSLYSEDGVDVLFGSDTESMTRDEIVSRAADLESRFRLSFKLASRARKVVPPDQLRRTTTGYGNAQVLTDSTPPAGYFDSLSRDSTIFSKVESNDRCPCGSGKKFRVCHGKLLGAKPRV